MTTKQKILLVAVAAVVASIIVVSVRSPKEFEVEAGTVAYDTLRVTVEDEGQTRAADRFTIAAPVTGRLARIALAEGDSVVAGAVVAGLSAAPEDPRSIAGIQAQIDAAVARTQEAIARVAQLEAASAQAAREVERNRRLFDAGAISREVLEQSGLAATSAEQSLAAAKAVRRSADAELSGVRARHIGAGGEPGGSNTTVVRSPGAGRVLRVLERSERVVPAGTPLLELASARGLEVVIDILSEDAVTVQPGNPIRITEWGGDSSLAARVKLVEPAAFTKVSALGVEEQRVNVVGELLQIPAALGTGYRVSAEIITWQGDRVLTVSTSALFRQGQTWRVFVIEEGHARLREVQLGKHGRALAEVLGGLTEGEVVVHFPSAEISEGVRVRPTLPLPPP
jgi:HlyD family secretion protein